MFQPGPNDPKPDISLPLQLRQAKMHESKPELQFALGGAATQLDEAIKDLWDDRTSNNLMKLNGLWAAALRVWYARTPLADPPSGGHMLAEQERMAA
jgi:hypothetical protein